MRTERRQYRCSIEMTSDYGLHRRSASIARPKAQVAFLAALAQALGGCRHARRGEGRRLGYRSRSRSGLSLERIISRRPAYVSIVGGQPADSSLLVSTTKFPLRRAQRSMRPHIINKRRTTTSGAYMVVNERPCILRNI